MKLYYIAEDEARKHIASPWHAIELGNGYHLVAVHWQNELHEQHWSARADVMALPHPIFESTKPLAAEHVTALAGLGILPGHDVHHAIKAAAKLDPWMRVHVL